MLLFMSYKQNKKKWIFFFFWTGQNWTKAAILNEGGQDLIHIRSRIKTFRLQVAKKMLYSTGMRWIDTVKSLLCKVDVLKIRSAFVVVFINLAEMDLMGFFINQCGEH